MLREGSAVTTDLTEAKAVELLGFYDACRREAIVAKKGQDRVSDLLRAYLEKHGGELVDGERGLRAFLQEREGPGAFDLVRAARLDPALIVWAAETGLLRMDADAFEALQDSHVECLGVKNYRMPGKPTTVLKVVKEKWGTEGEVA